MDTKLRVRMPKSYHQLCLRCDFQQVSLLFLSLSFFVYEMKMPSKITQNSEIL